VGKDAKGFQVKKAIFPEGTEKLDTHEECNQCNEPLFFAFRKSDLHPVLACVICGRLYLSNVTKKLLTRARNELIMNEDEKSSLFSFQLDKNTDGYSQTTKKKVELRLDEIPVILSEHGSGIKENTGAGNKIPENSPELNVGWQPASHFLSSQSKLTLSETSRTETGLKELKNVHSTFYELNFQIDDTDTRARIFDALLSINEVYSNQCWVSQRNQTLMFRAKLSVKKDLVKIILLIVGQLCGFNMQFGQEPNYKLLKENPAHLTNLLAVLKHLGQTWGEKSRGFREQHEEGFYNELLSHFLWDPVKDSSFVRDPVSDT